MRKALAQFELQADIFKKALAIVGEASADFPLIDQLINEAGAASVQRICWALGVSRSGYYAHRNKADGARRRQDEELRGTIAECLKASRHTYNTPRLRMDLRELWHRVGRRRIARLMREQGLRPKQKRLLLRVTLPSAPAATASLHVYAALRQGVETPDKSADLVNRTAHSSLAGQPRAATVLVLSV